MPGFMRAHTRYDVGTIQRALNALGPRDLGVREIREVPLDFHARFSAWRRDYRYLILNERWPAPLVRTRMLHVPQELDVVAMDQGIRMLVGEHDFVSFGAVSHGSTIRRCFEARCFEMVDDGRRIAVIEIAANGFLRHMVRAITGTLVLVGLGRLAPADVRTILERRDRAAGGPAAAPHGLYLESVRYEQPPDVAPNGPRNRWRTDGQTEE
jgi:tRNA pseudouridine38-40 synthase